MKLTMPEKHQLRIARQTLEMPTPMSNIMGGMTREQAFAILVRLGKKLAEREAQP